MDEHLLLDDNKYVADIMCEFRNSKLAKVCWEAQAQSGPWGCVCNAASPVLDRATLIESNDGTRDIRVCVLDDEPCRIVKRCRCRC